MHTTTVHLLSILLLAQLATADIDYPDDRRAAMQLFQAKQYEEAMIAFTGLAASDKTNEAQKSDAYEQAAMCALQLNQAEQAMNLAGKIPHEPTSKTVQLRILMQNRLHDRVITEFGDIDFDAWPEKQSSEAFYLRGVCYFNLKQTAKAEADLRNSLAYVGNAYDTSQSWLMLGRNYRENAKDNAKALDAFLSAIKCVDKIGGWTKYQSMIFASQILVEQNKPAEARQVLDRVDIQKLSGYWRDAFEKAHEQIRITAEKADETKGMNRDP